MSFKHKKQYLVLIVNDEANYIEVLKYLHELPNDKELNVCIVINSTNSLLKSKSQPNSLKVIHFPSNRKCEPHIMLMQLTKYFESFKYYYNIKDICKETDYVLKDAIHIIQTNNQGIGIAINSDKIRKELAKDVGYINRFRSTVNFYMNNDD